MKRTCTTQQHNTHIRELRRICYSWHPWHDREVWVHASLVRRGRAVAYCSLGDIQTVGFWKSREPLNVRAIRTHDIDFSTRLTIVRVQ